MKKAITFSLLILFLFNTLGYYFIFEIFKYQVKKEMRKTMHQGHGSLTVLQIEVAWNDPRLKRVEKKEIRYNGALYDVVSEVQGKGTTVFYCIRDKKEEDLLTTMNAVNKNKVLLSLWQHLIKIAFPPVEFTLTDPFPVKVIFPLVTEKLPAVIAATWSPPPEVS